MEVAQNDSVQQKVYDIPWFKIEEKPLEYLRNPGNKIIRPKITDEHGNCKGYKDEVFDDPNITDDDRRYLLSMVDSTNWNSAVVSIAKARKEGLFDSENLPMLETVENNTEALRAYCTENAQYEVFTQEYIKSLSRYLEKEVNELQEKTNRPMLIVEIGAGNGILSFNLLKEFKKDGMEDGLIKVTDLNEKDVSTVFPVEKLGYMEAINKYGLQHNLIVVCSWMPPNEDWLSSITKNSNVEEIVLIGPIGGICGTEKSLNKQTGFTKINIGEKYDFPKQFNHTSGGYTEAPSESISFKRK